MNVTSVDLKVWICLQIQVPLKYDIFHFGALMTAQQTSAGQSAGHVQLVQWETEGKDFL